MTMPETSIAANGKRPAKKASKSARKNRLPQDEIQRITDAVFTRLSPVLDALVNQGNARAVVQQPIDYGRIERNIQDRFTAWVGGNLAIREQLTNQTNTIVAAINAKTFVAPDMSEVIIRRVRDSIAISNETIRSNIQDVAIRVQRLEGLAVPGQPIPPVAPLAPIKLDAKDPPPTVNPQIVFTREQRIRLMQPCYPNNAIAAQQAADNPVTWMIAPGTDARVVASLHHSSIAVPQDRDSFFGIGPSWRSPSHLYVCRKYGDGVAVSAGCKNAWVYRSNERDGFTDAFAHYAGYARGNPAFYAILHMLRLLYGEAQRRGWQVARIPDAHWFMGVPDDVLASNGLTRPAGVPA